MAWWIWAIIVVYGLGFIFTMYVHMTYLQMVIFPLALLRAVVWPMFWTTGWPRGEPL